MRPPANKSRINERLEARYLSASERVERLTGGFFAPTDAAEGPELSDHARSIVAGWSRYPEVRGSCPAGCSRHPGPRDSAPAASRRRACPTGS